MNNKVKYLIITIAIMIVVILTGTFAWLTYQSNKTAMVLTIGDINNVQVTLQPYQINASIVPRTTFNDSSNNVVNVVAVNNTDFKKRISLYYDINEIDEALTSEDFKYVITRKTTTNGSFSTLKTGDFDNAVVGQPYEILNEKIPEDSTYEYKVYLWLDGTQTENDEGVSFNGELRAEINYDNRMKPSTSTSQTKVFDSGIDRTAVETITFLNVIPNDITNANQPQDVSVDQNNNVIAFFKDDNSNSKYELYIAADGPIVPTNLDYFFSRFSNVTQINNLNYLDTSKITSMSYTFQNCNLVLSLDLSSFDTSNVTNMEGMFWYCAKITTLNLSNFNTSKVTSMLEMFANCSELTTLDVSNFDTSEVIDMSDMFYGSSRLVSLDLSSFNTSKVTMMEGMFYNCSSLETIYVSDRWTTNALTDNGEDMFRGASMLPNCSDSFTDKTKAYYGTGGYLTYKPYP